ncbi:MAG: hypothetical protein L0Z53_23520 [Acidobacteriales bacterium]|nr:hypothetical protein [Terriglobales bacterium]
MRALVGAIALLCSSIPAWAAIPITPTTTLSAEASNNTSAASTFAAQSNGNAKPGNVSKLPIRDLLYPGATTKIYAHLMPWFGPSNHMDVGYNSADAAQVKRQVEDMISRGIDGAIVDWYGPDNTHLNNTTLRLMDEAELHAGFEFAVMEDVGAIRNATNPQQKLIDDLNFVNTTFAASAAYMRRGGRPVIFFFGIETLATPINWDTVRASVQGNPLFIFRNAGAFTKPQTNGGFAWLAPQTTVTEGYMSLGYLDDFYNTAAQFSAMRTFGSAFKGFDDSLAAWGQNRMIRQFCGQTWLSSMAEAGRHYSSGNQLENLQLVTWNDYEEGSELETGIDNCVSISASLRGNSLTWNITGSENTISHYTVFISLDGQNLMPLVDVAPGNRSVNLDSFDLGTGRFTFYVKAVGKPSILNHTSNGVRFPQSLSIAVSPASLTLSQGASGTLTVSLSPQGGSFDQPVTLSCSGLPAQGRCSFSPSSVTPGSQQVSSTLTIATASISAAHKSSGAGAPLFALWLAAVGAMGVVLTTPACRRRRYVSAAVLLVLALAMLQAGCGTTASSNAPPPVQTGTYSVVITGASGGEQFSTTATLTVR